MGDTELRMNLVDNYLKRFHDFQKIEWRFNKGKATLQDCWKFIVKSSYDPELALLKERLNDIEHKLERLSEKTSKIMDLPNVKLENNPLNGYYFRIPRKVCGVGK